MSTIGVRSSRNKIVVTVDKTTANVDLVLKFLDRLDVEERIRTIGFSKEILSVSGKIKRDWWKAHKKDLLK